MKTCTIKNLDSVDFSFSGGQIISVGETYTIPDVDRVAWITDDEVMTAIANSKLQVGNGVAAITGITEQITYLADDVAKDINIVKQNPFGDKSGHIFTGRGTSETVAVGETKEIEFVVESNTLGFDFSGLEIWADIEAAGDKCDMYVRDTATGTYSGYPNNTIGAFASNWNVHRRRCGKALPYTARLYEGMRIIVNYTNNHTASKEIFINYSLHKVR